MRRAARIGMGLVLLAGVLAAAGTCALPRPGLRPPAAKPDTAADSVVTVAGARYRAGPFRRALLGGGHREAWATPVRVEVLDLAAFAGGLAPVRTGGGRQTRALHLRGADGRTYVFRSVDKDLATDRGALWNFTLGRLQQDQVGALHPAAALAADEVQRAAGVLHASPTLVVMPDDPALGAFRGTFAGMLGMLEESPDSGFAGAGAVVGTDDLWVHLRRAPAERVDERAYLAARLVDVYLGDWDRHEGQWRWARLERAGEPRWVPVPRDRDYALVDYRGVLASLSRPAFPKVVRFDAGYRDLRGLLVAARPLDRRFLCGLPAAAWDSAALSLARALGDSAVTAAVRRLPPEYVRRDEGGLERTLRARRDRLPEAARRFRAALHARGGCAPPTRPSPRSAP